MVRSTIQPIAGAVRSKASVETEKLKPYQNSRTPLAVTHWERYREPLLITIELQKSNRLHATRTLVGALVALIPAMMTSLDVTHRKRHKGSRCSRLEGRPCHRDRLPLRQRQFLTLVPY